LAEVLTLLGYMNADVIAEIHVFATFSFFGHYPTASCTTSQPHLVEIHSIYTKNSGIFKFTKARHLTKVFQKFAIDLTSCSSFRLPTTFQY